MTIPNKNLTEWELKTQILCDEIHAGLSFRMNGLSGRVMEQIEASISDKEQRDALKNLIKNIIWGSCDYIYDDMTDVIVQFSNTFLGVETRKDNIKRVVDFNKAYTNAKK